MPEHEQRTDGQLLSAVVAGDGQSFAVFYRRHLPAVVAFLLRETHDREATADLAAEVFAEVFLAARRFRDRGGGSAPPPAGSPSMTGKQTRSRRPERP